MLPISNRDTYSIRAAGRMWRCLAERDLWGFKARGPSASNVVRDWGARFFSLDDGGELG